MNLTAEELTFIGLKIAPNPASYSMNIEQIPEGIQYLQILNQKGQLMRLLDVEGKVSINYDISALPSGIYYIRFQGNCVFGHEKFIKAY
jgi:hypothetical protein